MIINLITLPYSYTPADVGLILANYDNRFFTDPKFASASIQSEAVNLREILEFYVSKVPQSPMNQVPITLLILLASNNPYLTAANVPLLQAARDKNGSVGKIPNIREAVAALQSRLKQFGRRLQVFSIPQSSATSSASSSSSTAAEERPLKRVRTAEEETAAFSSMASRTTVSDYASRAKSAASKFAAAAAFPAPRAESAAFSESAAASATAASRAQSAASDSAAAAANAASRAQSALEQTRRGSSLIRFNDVILKYQPPFGRPISARTSAADRQEILREQLGGQKKETIRLPEEAKEYIGRFYGSSQDVPTMPTREDSRTSPERETRLRIAESRAKLLNISSSLQQVPMMPLLPKVYNELEQYLLWKRIGIPVESVISSPKFRKQILEQATNDLRSDVIF